ncbi:Inactive serine threonine-protein kinase [Recurvomyces mirabilis]|nr:Inactive serine threonine-protein kinase [Recurvomyces mirabilis]
MSNTLHCAQCPGKTFSRPFVLRRHLQAHENNSGGAYSLCDECGKIYRSREALQTHRLRVHQRRRLAKCSYCSKELASGRSYLEHHEQICRLRIADGQLKRPPVSTPLGLNPPKTANEPSTSSMSSDESAQLALYDHRSNHSTEALPESSPPTVGLATNDSIDIRLHDAARKGDQADIKALLEEDGVVASINARDETALMVGICRDLKGTSIQTARQLLKNGAGPNLDDFGGTTCLTRASALGDMLLCQLLVDYGADLSTRDLAGNTPLHYAAAGGHVNVVKLLLSLQPDLTFDRLMNNNGDTPLHFAAIRAYPHVVKQLLDMQPSVKISSLRNARGDTPLDVARSEATWQMSTSRRDKVVDLMSAHDTLITIASD